MNFFNYYYIKKLISTPLASVIIILLAIIARIWMQAHFAFIDTDKAYQIQAAQNLLAGNGLTIHDTLQPGFIPLVKWPPGYSFLLTPFLVICNNDPFLATILLDSLVALLFVLFSRKILLHLSLPVYLINIYTIVTGFFIYDFCTASTSDFLTLTLYIIALSICLSIIKSPRQKPGSVLLLAFLLFYTGFTRYMFIPVAFAIPAYLAAIGFVKNNKRLLKNGVSIFLLVAAFTVLFLAIQHSYAGAIAYIAPAEKGFYPEHLLRTYPFFLAAIFNINFLCVQLEKLTGIPFLTFAAILVWLNYVILFSVLLLSAKWIFKRKSSNPSLLRHYINLGILSSIVIISLLLFLSLTNKALKTHVVFGWSFVQEGRYFAFVTFFIQQLLFLLFAEYYESFKKWTRLLIIACFIILFSGVCHGIYYILKISFTKYF